MEDIATHTNAKKTPRPAGDRARKPRAKLPAGETREDKFVRLAEGRMTKVRAAIRRLCTLGRDYPHSEQQRGRVIAEVRRMAADVEAAFSVRDKADEFRF